MIYKVCKPRTELLPYINCFWVLEINNSDSNNIPIKTIPHGLTELITIYSGSGVINSVNSNFNIKPDIYFRGQRTNYTIFCDYEKIGIIACVFTPIGASSFFPIPINILQNLTVNLCDIIGHRAITWYDNLMNIEDIESKIHFIEEQLLQLMKERHFFSDKSIMASITAINQSQGRIFTKELANKIGLSEKQFERRFSSTVGTTPKKYARIVRFKSILQSINNNPTESLTSLTYNFGYSDQAHFIKEFKYFSGITPQKYKKNKLIQSPCFFSNQDSMNL